MQCGTVPDFLHGVGYNPTHMAAMLVAVLFFAHKIMVIGVTLGTRENETGDVLIIRFNEATGKSGPIRRNVFSVNYVGVGGEADESDVLFALSSEAQKADGVVCLGKTAHDVGNLRRCGICYRLSTVKSVATDEGERL